MERQSTSGFRIITVSCPSIRHGRILARVLLREKLAVCVNIVRNMESLYYWKGKVQSARECLLLIKTKLLLVSKTMDIIERLHSYECPVIEVLKIDGLNKKARQWFQRELGSG